MTTTDTPNGFFGSNLLTVNEAAERLGIGRTLLYGFMDAGELGWIALHPDRKKGRRIEPAELQRFIDRRRTGRWNVTEPERTDPKPKNPKADEDDAN
jgi:excisionase family DNA binding protein